MAAGREAQLAAFFDAYAAAFSTDDVSAIRQHWLLPALMTVAGRSVQLSDPEQFDNNSRSILKRYREAGMKRATARVSMVQSLIEPVTACRVDYRLLDRSEQPFIQWQHGYLLRELDSQFRIELAIADQELQAWQQIA